MFNGSQYESRRCMLPAFYVLLMSQRFSRSCIYNWKLCVHKQTNNKMLKFNGRWPLWSPPFVLRYSNICSSFSAAVLSELFRKWLYMSVVVLVRACPALPATVTSGTPPVRIRAGTPKKRQVARLVVFLSNPKEWYAIAARRMQSVCCANGMSSKLQVLIICVL